MRRDCPRSVRARGQPERAQRRGGLAWDASAARTGIAPLGPTERLFRTTVGATATVLIGIEELIRRIVARRSCDPGERPPPAR